MDVTGENEKNKSIGLSGALSFSCVSVAL